MFARSADSPAVNHVSADEYGQKAAGLSALPSGWTPSFVALSVNDVENLRSQSLEGESLSNLVRSITEQRELGDLVNSSDKIIVRSSARDEGVSERGSLESAVCEATVEDLASALVNCVRRNDQLATTHGLDLYGLVIQRVVSNQRQGHASNERRVSRRHDSWLVEVVDDRDVLVEHFRVSDRSEYARPDTSSGFLCGAESELVGALRTVAASTSELGRGRRHLEWVWDGSRVWVVQNDLVLSLGDGSPGDAWAELEFEELGEMSCLVRAIDSSGVWRKARCVEVFAELGFPTADLFVLEGDALAHFVADPDSIEIDLAKDLELLCQLPVLVRTDVAVERDSTGILLPRTETCLEVDDVRKFLAETSEGFVSSGLAPRDFCFLLHRYIPARAGSYAIAKPGVARVRVDAIWGVPDGLFYLPHDSFEVNLAHPEAEWRHYRCKYAYVDSRADGTWFQRDAGTTYDWEECITPEQRTLVAEQAAQIANAVGEPVEVMHFIGVSERTGMPACIPWFFKETDATAVSAGVAPLFAPNRRLISAPDDLVKLDADLASSLGSVAAVKLSADCQYLRDRDFVEDVGLLARKYDLVVDIFGSKLAHVFYLLQRAGVKVRAPDDETPPPSQVFEFDKLVRDAIPDRIESRGEKVVATNVDGAERLQLLRLKSVEEALEVNFASGRRELVEEIADLVEVVASICEFSGIDYGEVDVARRKKAESRGAFSNGVVLEATYVPSPLEPTGVGDPSEMLSVEEAVAISRLSSGDSVEISRVPRAKGHPRAIERYRLAGGDGHLVIYNYEESARVFYLGKADQLKLFDL